MNYKEFVIENPEIIDMKLGYTEYLTTKFSNISKYLRKEIPNRQEISSFEENNVLLLENIAVSLEKLIYEIEKK